MTRWIAAALVAVSLVGVGSLIVATNQAPDVPEISAADRARSSQPFVVKLHANWCVVCLVTRAEWATIQDAYAGRVRLVVFDFTTAATTEASRTEAVRLGLGPVFDDYRGETGSVLVLNADSKQVRHALRGNLTEGDYRAAIDAELDGEK